MTIDRFPRAMVLAVGLLTLFPRTGVADQVAPFGVVQDLAWDAPADVDPIIARMADAGVRIVRMDFRWYMFEPANDVWSFDVHDAIVAKLRARGIEILGLLTHSPSWANGGDLTGTTPPVSDADWGDFVRHVAERYEGQVGQWEIWNEPNLDFFFKPQPNAVRYVSMLRTAFEAIRSVDPAATVVLGGLGGNGVFMGWEPPISQHFLQKIYDAGGKGYFDVVAIHPYVHPVTAGIQTLRTFVEDTREVMAANGEAAKPLWLTEIGWSTAVDAWGGPTITETDAANWVESLYRAQPTLDAERVFWYNFRDLAHPTDLENHFGLLRRDLTEKPGYSRYTSLARPWFSKISPPEDAGSPPSVALSWGASAGAGAYEYCVEADMNGACDGGWTAAGAATSVTVSLPARTAWQWQVRATGSATTEGNTAHWWSFHTTNAFSDDPIVPASTPIRAVHFVELRSRIDAVRARFALPAYPYTAAIVPGATIRSADLLEMRAALGDAYVTAGLVPPTYTASPQAGGFVMAVHIAELRAAVIAVE